MYSIRYLFKRASPPPRTWPAVWTVGDDWPHQVDPRLLLVIFSLFSLPPCRGRSISLKASTTMHQIKSRFTREQVRLINYRPVLYRQLRSIFQVARCQNPVYRPGECHSNRCPPFDSHRWQRRTTKGTNCDVAQTNNESCGVLVPGSNSYGPSFNDNGGGW